MIALTDDQIRLAILETLHRAAKDEPGNFGVDRNTLQKAIGISEKQMDFNVLYLEEKRLVKLQKFLGSLWAYASITAFGMDVIEHKDKYSDQLPFTQATITIQGNVYGNVVQAINSQVDFNQQMTDAFKNAYDQVDAKAGITPEEKEAIKKNLIDLEADLKSKEPDVGKIQKTLGWLKQNASWVIPLITKVVLEGTKRILGV